MTQVHDRTAAPDAPPSGREPVRSFARSSRSLSTVTRPEDDLDWAVLLATAGARGVTVRGAGASYSDAALNSGGTVALTSPRNPASLPTPDADGVVEVDAGTTLRELLDVALPAGWMLPVLPGTADATVGGAVAADVHGKDHPRSGSFGAHVDRLDLLTPGEGLLQVGPDDRPDVFWATTGGLGLTGVIRRVRLRLAPVSSSWMRVGTTATADLGDALDLLSEDGHDHAVAWLDGHGASGRVRGVVTTADHVPAADLPVSQARTALRSGPARRGYPVPGLGVDLVHPALVRTANAARYAAARTVGTDTLRHVVDVLLPLDRAPHWPRLYGRRGLVQYQVAAPADGAPLLRHVLRTLQEHGCPPALVTLKRLGRGSPGPLSFPRPGWTLAADLPAGYGQLLAALLDRLDADVVAAGGRVYLVKDSRMRRHHLAAMYPRLDEWREVRAGLDPAGVLTSDLDRRLDLTGMRERDRR